MAKKKLNSAQTRLKVNLFVHSSNCAVFLVSLAVLQMRNFAGTTKVLSPLKHSSTSPLLVHLFWCPVVVGVIVWVLSLVDIIR